MESGIHLQQTQASIYGVGYKFAANTDTVLQSSCVSVANTDIFQQFDMT